LNSGTWECRQMPNFRGNEDLCKLGKEYLSDLLCKFGPFCLQHSKTFDISHAFLLATVAELSMLKQVRFFWPTLYIFSRCATAVFKLIYCELLLNQFFIQLFWAFTLLLLVQLKKLLLSMRMRFIWLGDQFTTDPWCLCSGLGRWPPFCDRQWEWREIADWNVSERNRASD